MNKLLSVLMLVLVTTLWSAAQESSSTSEKQWNFGADANFYIFPDDFFVLPVFRADKNNLHLEARYNYEDMETFSGWVGYNFSGGDEFEYTFTPMIGGVVGLSNGIAPGLELTLTYKNFEFYSEMENLFDLGESENNFYYNWTDLTYSPTDWLWLGISGQRTRLYQTDVEIQRGLILGGGFKQWELNSYFYNLDVEDPFFIITLAVSF